MEIIQKVAGAVTKTYQGAAKETEKLAKKMKLNTILAENQEKIEELFQEIGKAVYQKHLLDGEDEKKIVYIEEELMNECSKIDSLADEIADTRKQLLKLKEKKECRVCREEVLLEAKFCPYCGARQEKVTFAEIKKECEEQTKKEGKNFSKHNLPKRGRPKKEKEEKREEERKEKNSENRSNKEENQE